MVDIASALGIGSGIDTTALVTSLVSASRDPKQKLISARTVENNTRISAIASAKSSLSTFSTALTDLLSGTGYSGTPTSNDPTIAAVSLIPGGVPSGLPAQLEVRQLAAAQTLVSNPLAAASTPVGLGTLTLTTASGAKTITITAANNSLTGLAAAINDAGAGVTASVVTDNQGARLVLKGATGGANSFTLSAGTADADLQRFVYDGATQAMTRSQEAQDAIIKIDNVEQHYSDNVVKTALPFVRIDLNKAAPGTLVTLGSSEPTKSVRDLVTQFVAAYNTLRSSLNGATRAGTATTDAGALAGDSGVRDMINKLAAFTSTTLNASGTYKTLADIGVKTGSDGTLSVDTVRLDKVLATDPTAVTQMLNPAVTSPTNPGLAGAMAKLNTAITGTSGALIVSQKKYDQLQKALADDQAKLDADMSKYSDQLTATYSKMQATLTALKATQTYVTQQIAVWNNSSN